MVLTLVVLLVGLRFTPARLGVQSAPMTASALMLQLLSAGS